MNSSFRHVAYLLLSFIIIPFHSTGAYTMPVGIPAPDINFEQEAPARPSDWSKEVPGYYYIDLVNGSYSPSFGSETAPRKMLPQPIPAGSYVEIAGDYDVPAGGFTRIIANGTNSEWVANTSGPVWITKAKNKPGSFTGHKVVLWGENAFLTDMLFKDKSLLQIGSPSSGYAAKNIVARNNEIIGVIDGGTLLSTSGGSPDSKAENIIFYNNTIHDAGDINSSFDQDAHLMTVSGYTSNVWILKNTGYNASGSGLQVNGAPPRIATHNVYVGDNEIYNVRQSGLWVKFAQNVIFSGNYIHNIVTTPWSVSKGIGAQYEPDGLWMINNRIHDVEYGIRIASTYDVGETILKVYTVGNIIYNVTAAPESTIQVGSENSWQSAAIHLVGGHEHYIYNNLIFNVGNGITTSSHSHKTLIENNIIFDVINGHASGESGYNIWSEGNKGTEKLIVDNNFLGGGFKVKLHHTIYERTALLDAGGHLNNVTNPIAVDSTDIESIFSSLMSNQDVSTLLKDKGKNNNYFLQTSFKEIFPNTTGLDRDILNKERELGASIDIGPFEQDGAKNEVTPPQSPTNVQVLITPQ
ncbi:hypothetical protein CW745_08860 [Psychromonas sp. psych-6C06]|uniref:right-handed parallel beta-helix repeat-containing protein n=1 Tax=Psychromonas sp. psych-6C06 TaxID=2058089 RepID=UPI000C32E414|nr:right-handed parallel beta-helix repeat-containing protein [Psychromonas sp. psych-6C06]PKF61438.1 hypothetical protein CW745_08860 [Psychromonas sp. psych-6C06]